MSTRTVNNNVIRLRIVPAEPPARKNDLGEWQKLGDVVNKLLPRLR